MNKLVFLPSLFLVALLVRCDKEDCVAEKKEDCITTLELNPVCGCDGVTYDNPSLAACNSIEDYTMGACE